MHGVPDMRLAAGFRQQLWCIRLLQIGGAELVLAALDLEGRSCRDYADGVLRGMDEGAVDLLINHRGLGAALVEVGLLEPSPKGLRWVRWEERQPYAASARDRSLQASRAGKESARKRKGVNPAFNAQSTPGSTEGQRSVHPRPDPSRPNPSRPVPTRSAPPSPEDEFPPSEVKVHLPGGTS